MIQGEMPAVEQEGAPGAPGRGLERIKRLSIDIPASLHRPLKLACMEADRTISEEVLALIERHVAELETAAAMERFAAVARERGMVLGELMDRALDAFMRETKER
jgi:hypothetical protein